MAFCPKCRKENHADSEFCGACGTPLKASGKPTGTVPSRQDSLTTDMPALPPFLMALIQAAFVFGICAIIPLFLGSVLGWPTREIKDALPDWNCVGETPGSNGMYLCSAKVGALAIAAPVILLIIIFIFRKPLIGLVTRLNSKLPEILQFILPPVFATIVFTMAWAGFHEETWDQSGILPHKIFPAFIGLFTYTVGRFGPGIQQSLSHYFNGRDKVPVLFRYLLVLAIPMGISYLITDQDRVSQEALKEQFVCLVALVVAFLLVSPRFKPSPLGGKRGGTGLVGRVAMLIAMAIPAGLALDFMLDWITPETALAHDCSSEWDCQQTSGYNAATATGGGAMGAAAGVIGAQAGTAAEAAVGGAVGGGAGGAAAAGVAGVGAGAATTTTRIIDGNASRNWLINEGFIRSDGTITDKFRTWWSQIGGADPSRLDGIAGDINWDEGRVEGNIAIVIRDRDTVPQVRPAAGAGDAATVVTENYSPGVDIRGTHDYIEHTRTYLNRIQNTPEGQDLLNQILLDGAGGGHNVTIVDSGAGNGNVCTGVNADGQIQADGSKGPGCSTNVQFNPYRHSLNGAATLPDGSPDPTDWRNRPPDVGLHHEMNHSWHATRGDIDMSPAPNPGGGNTIDEELRTVSLGPYSGNTVDENAYRARQGLPNRPTY
jgi:lipid-A-disaccharide synthase-like uncharacterized protein